jgi:hypothetical protein
MEGATMLILLGIIVFIILMSYPLGCWAALTDWLDFSHLLYLIGFDVLMVDIRPLSVG